MSFQAYVASVRMGDMALVKNWLGVFAADGKSKADALRNLNAVLGSKYDTSHLSRWERGEREPGPDARHHMTCLVLRREMPKSMSDAAVLALAEKLR